MEATNNIWHIEPTTKQGLFVMLQNSCVTPPAVMPLAYLCGAWSWLHLLPVGNEGSGDIICHNENVPVTIEVAV